jgi:hypothetical protein
MVVYVEGIHNLWWKCLSIETFLRSRKDPAGDEYFGCFNYVDLLHIKKGLITEPVREAT